MMADRGRRRAEPARPLRVGTDTVTGINIRAADMSVKYGPVQRQSGPNIQRGRHYGAAVEFYEDIASFYELSGFEIDGDASAVSVRNLFRITHSAG